VQFHTRPPLTGHDATALKPCDRRDVECYWQNMACIKTSVLHPVTSGCCWSIILPSSPILLRLKKPSQPPNMSFYGSSIISRRLVVALVLFHGCGVLAGYYRTQDGKLAWLREATDHGPNRPPPPNGISGLPILPADQERSAAVPPRFLVHSRFMSLKLRRSFANIVNLPSSIAQPSGSSSAPSVTICLC
jgi:hypothetical protein